MHPYSSALFFRKVHVNAQPGQKLPPVFRPGDEIYRNEGEKGEAGDLEEVVEDVKALFYLHSLKSVMAGAGEKKVPVPSLLA